MSGPYNNHEQQPIRIASPEQSLAHLLRDPPRDRELPPHPPPTRSETELSGQTPSEFPHTPNPTTLASPTTADKSVPNSLYDPPHFPVTSRKASVNVSAQEYDRANGRYSTVARPRPVFAADSNAVPQTSRMQSGLEWIVPNADNKRREKTVAERLEPTLTVARRDRDEYSVKAKWQGMLLNGAIGLQVVCGALTTGVAAATTGRATSIGVSILGGLSTMLASYSAKARGSGEPDFSRLRARELDTFVREVEAWTMDKGHSVGTEHDDQINTFRIRFEQIIKTEGEDSASGTSFGQTSSKATEKV